MASLAQTPKHNINYFLIAVCRYASTHSLQSTFPFHASLKSEQRKKPKACDCAALDASTPFSCTDNTAHY